MSLSHATGSKDCPGQNLIGAWWDIGLLNSTFKFPVSRIKDVNTISTIPCRSQLNRNDVPLPMAPKNPTSSGQDQDRNISKVERPVRPRSRMTVLLPFAGCNYSVPSVPGSDSNNHGENRKVSGIHSSIGHIGLYPNPGYPSEKNRDIIKHLKETERKGSIFRSPPLLFEGCIEPKVTSPFAKKTPHLVMNPKLYENSCPEQMMYHGAEPIDHVESSSGQYKATDDNPLDNSLTFGPTLDINEKDRVSNLPYTIPSVEQTQSSSAVNSLEMRRHSTNLVTGNSSGQRPHDTEPIAPVESSSSGQYSTTDSPLDNPFTIRPPLNINETSRVTKLPHTKPSLEPMQSSSGQGDSFKRRYSTNLLTRMVAENVRCDRFYSFPENRCPWMHESEHQSPVNVAKLVLSTLKRLSVGFHTFSEIRKYIAQNCDVNIHAIHDDIKEYLNFASEEGYVIKEGQRYALPYRMEGYSIITDFDP